jgi:hypothetical protein
LTPQRTPASVFQALNRRDIQEKGKHAIAHVREQHVMQMAFAEHHDMINAFPAD